MTKSNKFDFAIPSDLVSSAQFKSLFIDQLLHAKTREYFLQIIEEYCGQVAFMKVVRGYAADELDNRMFRSVRYWGSVLLTTILTSLVAYFIGRYLPH